MIVFFGVGSTNSMVLKAGKIYGFDWKIDSVTIEY